MRFMQTVTAKVLFIGALILFLLIPKFMIQDLVRERTSRQNEVKLEINEKWGRAQTLSGPIIEVPYVKKSILKKAKNSEDERVSLERSVFYIAPNQLTLDTDIKTEVRNRSIFDTIVYTSKIKGKGILSVVKDDLIPRDSSFVFWEEAVLQIGISDVQGLGDRPNLKWGDKTIPFDIIRQNQGSILSAAIGDFSNETKFSFDINLKGSEALLFASSAESTSIDLVSDWETPSFFGSTLPTTHNIKTAHWDIQNFEKPRALMMNIVLRYDQYNEPKMQSRGDVVEASGVKFIFPVDFYQKNERAIKYAILFIILTFVAFFLIEILQKYRLHPIQYLLVGFAMVLFYALLLSFSEHMSFGKAYVIAAGTNILLITGYALAIFKTKSSAGIILGLLSGIYIYLFSLLKSQDYALLSGTIFLFMVLSIIMYLTRNIDWYEVNTGKEQK